MRGVGFMTIELSLSFDAEHFQCEASEGLRSMAMNFGVDSLFAKDVLLGKGVPRS